MIINYLCGWQGAKQKLRGVTNHLCMSQRCWQRKRAFLRAGSSLGACVSLSLITPLVPVAALIYGSCNLFLGRGRRYYFRAFFVFVCFVLFLSLPHTLALAVEGWPRAVCQSSRVLQPIRTSQLFTLESLTCNATIQTQKRFGMCLCVWTLF